MLLQVRTRGDQHKKAQEDSGSSVAYKTIGTFLLQRVQGEDNLRVGHRQVCRSNAAVRNLMPSLSRDPWICHVSS